MELGKHIEKGVWGFADKALPAVYGFAFILLVIRALPEAEYGNYVLVQTTVLIITGLATAFALQPLLKFVSEASVDHRHVISAAFLLDFGFLLLASLAIVASRHPFSLLLKAPALQSLLLYVPALLAASFVRNFAVTLLQAKFQIVKVFVTDAVYFLGVPVVIVICSHLSLFHTAEDLIFINIAAFSASSVLGFLFARPLFRLTLILPKERIKSVWDYGRYSLGGTVSYLFTSQADSFVLSSFGGPGQVAIYNSAKVFIRVYDVVAQVVQMFIIPGTSRYASRDDKATVAVIVEKAILFATVAMIPVCIVLLVLPSPLVHLLYHGKYTEAIPLLRVFSLLTFLAPIVAVTSSTIMGIGQARLGFVLGLQILVASSVIYLVCIPLWGTMGAAVGYVLSFLVLAILTTRTLNPFIPVSLLNVLRRYDDILSFVGKHVKRP